MKGYVVQWDASMRRGWVLGSDGIERAFGSNDVAGTVRPVLGARVVYQPAVDSDPPTATGVQVTQLPVREEEGVLVTQVRLSMTSILRLLLQFSAACLVIWLVIMAFGSVFIRLR